MLVCFVTLSLNDAFAQKKRKNKKAGKPPVVVSAHGGEYYFIEAEKFFLLEDYTKAVELFKKCLVISGENDAAHFKLAQIYNYTEEYDKAIPHALTALELNNSNKFYYLLAVDIYTNKSDLEGAAKMFEQLLEKVPKSEEYLFDLAAVYVYKNDLNKAIQTYDRIEKAFGVNEQATAQKQKVLLRLNRVEDAIKEGEKLIKAVPSEPRYVIRLCEILASNNKGKEARALLENLLNTNDEVPIARLLLADLYAKEKMFDLADEQLQIAFYSPEVNPNAKINVLMSFLALIPNERMETQLKVLGDILVKMHEGVEDVHLIRGDIYTTFLDKKLVEKDEIDHTKSEAVASYAKYLSYNQSNFTVWQNLLNLELQLNRPDSVIAHSENALEYYPEQAWLYLINGAANLQMKRNNEAIEMFEMGKKRAANNKGLLSLFYGYLGDTYNSTNQYAESDKAYESALEINPNNSVVLNNYSYFLSLRHTKLELAKKMSVRLIRNNPDNNTYLDTYAWVHYHLKDFEEAKRVLEKVVKGGDVNGEQLDHYGDVLFQLGEIEEAVKQWNKARNLDKTLENIDKKIAERKIIQ